jgi:hypothetical protein
LVFLGRLLCVPETPPVIFASIARKRYDLVSKKRTGTSWTSREGCAQACSMDSARSRGPSQSRGSRVEAARVWASIGSGQQRGRKPPIATAEPWGRRPWRFQLEAQSATSRWRPLWRPRYRKQVWRYHTWRLVIKSPGECPTAGWPTGRKFGQQSRRRSWCEQSGQRSRCC